MELSVKLKKYLIITVTVFLLLILVLLIIVKPGKNFVFRNETSTYPKHEIFTQLLEEYVDNDGMVNYDGIAENIALLNRYLQELEQNPPDSRNWAETEELAYWINAYNAYTLQLIIKHYPLSSIKDIGSFIQVPFINSAWDIPFIEIGEEKLTLNDIEHRILRKEYNEPRIHFAIVCASISCPKLRPEAYVSSKLNDQLEEQAVEFINDESKNLISADQIEISRIFQWFGGDFKKGQTLIDYLNKYSRVNIRLDAEVGYLDYNWGLNE